MGNYYSPFRGEQVDSAVSAIINGTLANSITVAVSGGVESAISYTDVAVSGGVTEANAYTDETVSGGVAEANHYTDIEVSGALVFAGEYTDNTVSGGVEQANTYTNTTVSGALVAASEYTDSGVSGANTYTNTAVSGASTYAAATAAAALANARIYTDQRTTMVSSSLTGSSIVLDVLSGGYFYDCSEPIGDLSVTAIQSNSLGDIVHFTAISGGITIDLPAGQTVLLWDTVNSGSAYDFMACDNRVILKEVVALTSGGETS